MGRASHAPLAMAINRIFDSIDRNSDGRPTKEEIRKAVRSDRTSAAQLGPLAYGTADERARATADEHARVFATVDANPDGTIDREEFERWIWSLYESPSELRNLPESGGGGVDLRQVHEPLSVGRPPASTIPLSTSAHQRVRIDPSLPMPCSNAAVDVTRAMAPSFEQYMNLPHPMGTWHGSLIGAILLRPSNQRTCS